MVKNTIQHQRFAEQLQPYENKWVALDGETVVAAGNTPEEVKQYAEQTGVKKYAFYFVPSSDVSFIPLLWR
jgi:hypothetical protein